MPEEIKLKMARAYPAQIQRVREWFQKLDELFDDDNTSDAEYGLWLVAHYGEVENDWERILFGYDTLIENACDQTKSYLEFKPEILEAFAVANKTGELVEAVENVLEFLKEPVVKNKSFSDAVERLGAALEKLLNREPSNPEIKLNSI